MTECSQSQFELEAHGSRQVLARFDGSRLTTDGGGLLLRQADRKIGLLKRLVGCLFDSRDADRIEHGLGEMREAKREQRRTEKAARVFTEFFYRTRVSWSRSRRVVSKAEHLEKGENPRFVVTSPAAGPWPARAL